MIKPLETVSEWYETIYSRRVDLVGDYAGAELFLLEGDSLLLHAFSDSNLDFSDNGFQLLHAAYNVELFLKKLVARNASFTLPSSMSTSKYVSRGTLKATIVTSSCLLGRPLFAISSAISPRI